MMSRLRTSRAAKLFMIGLALLVLTGLTHTALSQTATADRQQQRPFRITWQDCEGSPPARCGTLRVPVDWSRP